MVDKIIEHLKRVETDYGIDLTKEIEWLRNINYEEKYEKALLKARDARQNTESAVTIGILEEIFPELRESEDEKIRKEIVDFITSSNKYGTNERCEAWLNWLEKQGKESITIDASPVASYDNVMISDIKNNKKQDGKPQRMISAEAKEALYNKPAWSEEDKAKINRIVTCLENLNVADNDILLKDIDWLKSFKERIGG